MEEKYFSEEHFLLRDMVRDLAKNDIAKLAQDIDELGEETNSLVEEIEKWQI